MRFNRTGISGEDLTRFGAFMAVLVFMSVSFQWDSNQLLPWVVRGLGLVLATTLTPVIVRSWILKWLVRRALIAEQHPRATVMVLAAASLVVTLGLAYFVLEPFPHVPDGFSYYFQARIFASGRLYAAAPALPQFFECPWVTVRDGRWFSIFPPGWPLLLAIGLKLGAPAFVDPVLGALCVVVVYQLGAILFGTRHGLIAAFFCCLSPFFLFMSAEFMSHTATMLFTTLSVVCHLKAMRKPSGMGWFAASGAAAGIGFLIRPVDSLVVWAAQIIHGLWTRRSRRSLTGAIVSVAALACGVGLYVAYNRILLGEWFASPLLVVSPNSRLGFGPDIGYTWAFSTPGHTPWRALLNLNFNAAVINQDLFGWPIPCLFFVVLLAVFGRSDERHALCGLVILFQIAAYALFWYHGVIFGARLYFTLLPFLLLLTVEGIRQAPDIVRRFAPSISTESVSRVSMAFVSLCFAFGWVVYMPKVSLVAPYYNQRGINSGLDAFITSRRPENAIVFVRAPRVLDYGPGFIQNQVPMETSRIIYALDLGDAANRQLAEMFQGRNVESYTSTRERNFFAERLRALAQRAVLIR